MIRHRLATLAAVLAIAACVPHPAVAAAPQPSFALATEVRADTVRVTAAACNTAPFAVACRVTLSGTIGGTAISFASVPDLTIGQSVSVAVNVTCSNRAAISVTVTSRSLNADGDLSAPTSATGAATCPASPPGQQQTFTVTVSVSP